MEANAIIGLDSAYICAKETGYGNMQISAGLVVELIDRLRESEAELSTLPGKWREDSSLETWFPLTNDELVSLRDENLKLKAELEAIKKQEPVGYVHTDDSWCGGGEFHARIDEDLPDRTRLYSRPVYQHSFTVDGHTFYADNEVDILYLERKFGVGGKAKLNLVEDK